MFTKGRLLGEGGSQCAIYSAIDNKTQLPCALKMLDITRPECVDEFTSTNLIFTTLYAKQRYTYLLYLYISVI